MKNTIHKTAIVDKKIKLGNNVAIGPYSVIGPNVQIKNNVNAAVLNQKNVVGDQEFENRVAVRARLICYNDFDLS